MSKTFASAFLEAQRKKKKREEDKALQEYIKSYNFVQGKTGSSNTIGTSATLNPPTKATYFDKGAFSDGYQRGDVVKTILGTLNDVGENVNTAVIDATENLIDTTAAGIGFTAGLFKKGKNFKKKTGNFIAKDLLQSQKVGEWITKYGSYANAPAAIARAIVGDNVEEYSVLGDKSDSLVQAASHVVGQQALARLGVPSQLTSAVNAFGSQMEAKLQEGKSFDQAHMSGLISAGAEILTEKLGGIKFGGKALTDIAKKAFGKKVANKAIQFLVSLGLDLASEGAEEVASGVINAMGDDFLNLSDKKWHEIYTKEQALDDFIGGAILGAGGNVVGAGNAKAKGVDAVTGLTKNEQAVVQAVYDSRIADMKKNGEKASVLKKDKLWDDIVTKMRRGELSTDDIERVLGGDTYTEYQSRIDQVENIQKKIDALQTEHDDLNQKLPAEMRGIDNDRLAELKKELPKLKSQLNHWTSDTKAQEVADLKAKLSSEVYALSKGTNLAESYHEIARRKQVFNADLSQYNEKEAVIVQKAIDSGVLNNTNHTHEFVDLVARLAAAKDLDFDFTTNKRLAESGFAIDGVTINGMVDKNTKAVTINMNSAKALETVVGHEITHILENTDLYTPLQEAVKQYATTKGEYDSRLEAITELYKNEEGADVVKELTADLVGDYIFSDADFVDSLAKGNRNLAQKILDEIKYMAKIATAGSKEKRQLEKAKKMLKDALETTTKTESTGNVDKSYSSITQTFFGNSNMTIEEFESGDYKSTEGYKNFVETSVENMRQTFEDFKEDVARKSVEKQIDGIVKVAIASKIAGYDIYDDGKTRDIRDSKGRKLFSSLEPNSDYFTSNDVSTICDKSKNFTEIYDAIVTKEQELGVPKGKRFFDDISNYFVLHKMLADKGLTQPCRECYVDSMRKNLAPMARNFLTLIQETDVNNKANDQLYNKSGKNRGELKRNNAKLRESVLKILEDHPEYELTAESITIDMLSTAKGLARLRIQAPYIYEAFNSFYGQSKPKMPKNPTPYRFGELTALLTDEHGKIKQNLVDRINSTGGFRLQSYSDFQIQNYVDVLQVLYEAGTLNLHGHAYTKVPAFLEATEGTNLKRNISIFMYKDGAEWKIDRNDSFPMRLKDIYDIVNADKDGDTGIIAVSQNNDMSAWIMANDNIAYGISFHKSGHTMKNVRNTDVKTEDGRTVKGYKDAKDHTRQQTEVWKTTTADHKALTKVKKGINIYQFWDFDNTEGLSHNDLIKKNLKNYIDACEEAGYIPKFRDYVMNNTDILNKTLAYGKKLGFLSEDASIEDISFKYKGYTIPYGYYKFLGDFGMFKPNGEASPIKAISLENYNFNKAVEFFEDAEKLHRNEILQQFASDGFRDEMRKSDLNADQLRQKVEQMRGEIANEVVKRYGNKTLSLSPTGTTESGRFMGKDIALEDEVIVEETPAVAPKAKPTDRASVLYNKLKDKKLNTYHKVNGYGVLVNRSTKSNDAVISIQTPNGSTITETIPNANQMSNEKLWRTVAERIVESEGEWQSPKLAPVKSAPTKTVPTRKVSAPVDASKVKTTPKTQNAVTVDEEASDGKMRRFVETATQSEVVDGQILPDDLVQGKIYYEPISNKEALEKANSSLNKRGYDEAIKHFDIQFDARKVTLEDIVLGERLIQESIKKGDTVTAGKLIEDVAILGTELGQKVQALSIIQRLTPEGQLRMLNRTIERAKAKLDKQFKGVEITQEMKDRILSVYDADGNYDQDALNEAMDNVIAEIADKMKTTVGDKANAWRYLSMLGNIKTHGRNMISNLANAVTIAGKDVVARIIETGVDIGAKITGKESPFEYRTKTWKFASRDVLDFAKKTVVEERAHIQGDDTSNIRKRILAKRKMFGKTFFTDLYNLNSKALTGEDWLFSKFAYKNALAEFLTANGIRTQADIDNNKKLVDKAKDYALDRARIATFQQDSWLANKISEIENKNLASKIAVGAVVPFKKTPINVAKAGFNYSPLGVAKTITYDAVRLAKGEITANTYIDNLSQGLTGSALVYVGYLLASKGILNGAGDDDKEGKYDYQLGEQRYSITVGNNTYTLNWLSPTAMPLFVGANMFEQFVEKREFDGNVVLQSIAQVLDPMSDMSFLSSLNDALSSYDSGIMKFVGIFKSMSQNYITQYIPTALSQTAATIDDTKRTTKASKTSSFRIGDETMRKIMYKIPGLRNLLEPVVDIWGNEVKQDERVIVRALDNYIMPYSKKYGIATNVDTEIKELYKETGDTGLIPSVPYDNISFKGTKYNMSAKQFTRFKQNYGQTAHDLMAKLFETETYQNASLDMQADMVNRVYDYARDEAKRKYLNTQGVTYTNTTEDGKEIYRENYIKGAVDNDMTVEEYKFSVKYPEKYDFFKANGISVDDYNNADDDGKDALNWANKYPEKYMVSKAVTPDLFKYKQYTKALNNIHAGDDTKRQKLAYIDSLDIDDGAKYILRKMEFPSDDSHNKDIVNYLMSKDDIGYNDMVTILTELGMKVSASGRVSL